MGQADESAIAVSLSGGGHRATLYGLGSLMALVDRELNRLVVQVSSVSGGSILNALLVHRGVNLATVSASDFDALARDLASIIARRGVLSRRWLAAMLIVVVGCGGLGGLAYAQTPAPRGWLFLAVVVGAAVPLLWLGKFVSWRLRRVHFPGRSARLMQDLMPTPVEHVFCASDLLTGFPVYVTTWDGGRLWRRTSDLGVIGGSPTTSGELWQANDLRLADVVRASAGFPGIPPRHIAVGHRRRFGGARIGWTSR
jgi:hypothetical protein